MSPITMAQKKKKKKKKNEESSSSSSSSSSLILSLPEDLLMHCIARVPKQNYRNLSRVCKRFLSIVTSPDLFSIRSLLKCTESCIYVAIGDHHNDNFSWYTLIRNANEDENKLVPVTSLPRLPSSGASCVAFGSKIFVIGDGYNCLKVKIIDCRFDVEEPSCAMPELVSFQVVSDVVDGKIYVIGGYYSDKSNREKRMLVLDVEAETWEYDMRTGLEDDDDRRRRVDTSVAMGGKIYARGFEKCFVFDPKEARWETFLANDDDDDDESLHSILGGESRCVIDEIVYTFDFAKGGLLAYDLKQRCYRGVVKGLEGLPKDHGYNENMVICCGEKKMMLFLLDGGDTCSHIIWCAEITLMEKKKKTKNETGEIWGNVEWCQVVYEGEDIFTGCLSVTV